MDLISIPIVRVLKQNEMKLDELPTQNKSQKKEKEAKGKKPGRSRCFVEKPTAPFSMDSHHGRASSRVFAPSISSHCVLRQNALPQRPILSHLRPRYRTQPGSSAPPLPHSSKLRSRSPARRKAPYVRQLARSYVRDSLGEGFRCLDPDGFRLLQLCNFHVLRFVLGARMPYFRWLSA